MWDGLDEGAMFHLTGESTLIEKVTIGNAPVGILLGKEQEGIGTGKVIMRDCYFNGCETAVKIGPSDNNNDEVTLDHVTVEGCETLLRINNKAAMGFRIRSCFVKDGQKNNSDDVTEYWLTEEVNVKDIIDVRAGGCVYVEDMTVIHADSILKFNPDLDGTIKDITGSSYPIERIGSNNGFFSLKNIKLDVQAGTPKVVDMAEYFNVRIIVENVQAPRSPWQNAIDDDDPATMYNLKGRTAISIRDCNLFKDCISWKTLSTNFPNITLDHCSLGNSPTSILEVLSHTKSNGKCYISTRNCYDYDSHASLPDISAYVEAK